MKTTREAAKEASHKQLAGHLQDLLDRNYDAEKGYKKAMEHTDNVSLKHFLREQAAIRNHFGTEIDKRLHQLNEHPKLGRNGFGNLYKFWSNFISSFNRRDDEAILSELIRTEKNAIRIYEDKMKKFHFPPDIKEMLDEHVKKFREILSNVKVLEDLE